MKLGLLFVTCITLHFFNLHPPFTQYNKIFLQLFGVSFWLFFLSWAAQTLSFVCIDLFLGLFRKCATPIGMFYPLSCPRTVQHSLTRISTHILGCNHTLRHSAGKRMSPDTCAGLLCCRSGRVGLCESMAEGIHPHPSSLAGLAKAADMD